MVTYDVPSYFNVFECRRNILNRLDVTYEQACMATPRDKYYTKMLETLIDHNDHHNAPFPVRRFDKQSSESWHKKNRKNVTPNATPII